MNKKIKKTGKNSFKVIHSLKVEEWIVLVSVLYFIYLVVSAI